MAVPGQQYRSIIGADSCLANNMLNSGFTTYALAPLNSHCQLRFQAQDTRDIYSVWLNWSSVSAPGVVDIRIETVDTSTGKATGTLYDTNAVLASQTPAAGWQQYTFSTPPSTGLTAGNLYAIVVVCTTGGTTQTLTAGVAANQGGPAAPLFVTANSTRSSAVETAGAMPVFTLGLSDGAEETPGSLGCSALTSVNIFGTANFGAKFIVPSGETWNIAGAWLMAGRAGTPADDLRCRILDTTTPDGVVATVIAPKYGLLSANLKRPMVWFPSIVTLNAGTYRLVFDSASSANGSNCFTGRHATHRTAGLVPSGWTLTSGVVGTWAGDSTSSWPLCGLYLDSIPVTAGGSTIITPQRKVFLPANVRVSRRSVLIPGQNTVTTVAVPLPRPARVPRQTYIAFSRARFIPGANTVTTVTRPINKISRISRQTVVQQSKRSIIAGQNTVTTVNNFIRGPRSVVTRNFPVRSTRYIPAPQRPVFIPVRRGRSSLTPPYVPIRHRTTQFVMSQVLGQSSIVVQSVKKVR